MQSVGSPYFEQKFAQKIVKIFTFPTIFKLCRRAQKKDSHESPEIISFIEISKQWPQLDHIPCPLRQYIDSKSSAKNPLATCRETRKSNNFSSIHKL